MEKKIWPSTEWVYYVPVEKMQGCIYFRKIIFFSSPFLQFIYFQKVLIKIWKENFIFPLFGPRYGKKSYWSLNKPINFSILWLKIKKMQVNKITCWLISFILLLKGKKSDLVFSIYVFKGYSNPILFIRKLKYLSDIQLILP